MKVIQFMLEFIKNLFKKEKEEIINVEKPLLTLNQLLEINNYKNESKCKEYIDALNTILPSYGLKTELRLCHFLAQILHESGNLTYESENLNYSASALRSVFGKYFKTDQEAQEYAHKPEKIANKVYANRMGNGNEASGEGWKFRGRGLIQLTGRNNYMECGKALGIDLISDPDLICKDKSISIKAACWFWDKNKLNELADKDDIVAITKKINGGTNGIAARQSISEKAKEILLLEK